MAVRIAQLALMNVNPTTGEVYNRGGNVQNEDGDQIPQDLPIKGVLSFDTQHRVVVDPDNSNTADNPTVATYLEREDTDGRKLRHLDQSQIITSD